MEPNDLNSTPPDDAQLDTWLRAQASLPALADDGFSQRVLTALPAPQTSRVSPRLLAILLGAVMGIAFASFQFSTAAPVDFSLPAIGPQFTDALALLTDPKLHVAFGVTVITLAFAFWRDLRRQIGW